MLFILLLSSRDLSSETLCMLKLNLEYILNIWKVFEVRQTVFGFMWLVGDFCVGILYAGCGSVKTLKSYVNLPIFFLVFQA